MCMCICVCMCIYTYIYIYKSKHGRHLKLMIEGVTFHMKSDMHDGSHPYHSLTLLTPNCDSDSETKTGLLRPLTFTIALSWKWGAWKGQFFLRIAGASSVGQVYIYIHSYIYTREKASCWCRLAGGSSVGRDIYIYIYMYIYICIHIYIYICIVGLLNAALW